jgi:hypothetical protein
MKKRRPTTWQDIYDRHIRAGDDISYALFAADEWARRKRLEATKTGKGAGPWQVWEMRCNYCAHKWIAVVYEGTTGVACPNTLCGLENQLITVAPVAE